ncbi:MAG: hypothetical protein ACI80H_001599 [Pseudoalteromonas distincta]|jgi:hypothetical protein
MLSGRKAIRAMGACTRLLYNFILLVIVFLEEIKIQTSENSTCCHINIVLELAQ